MRRRLAALIQGFGEGLLAVVMIGVIIGGPIWIWTLSAVGDMPARCLPR